MTEQGECCAEERRRLEVPAGRIDQEDRNLGGVLRGRQRRRVHWIRKVRM